MTNTIVAETALTPLAVGSQAPAFSLPAAVPGSEQAQTVSLSDYAGQNLIIVFYPKDQTPGCTQQLCALRDDLAMFKDLNTAVIASNFGSLSSHQRFIEKQAYTFPILVDAERTMAAAYQALKENGESIQRTVYIVDGVGVIRFAQQGMPKDEALAEVIRSLG